MMMIAKKLGVSFWQVRQAIRAAGITRKRGDSLRLAYALSRREPYCDHQRQGSTNPNWKGGRWVDSKGYIWMRCEGHPRATSRGSYVLEHRLVMEQHLDRYLVSSEVVHHVNGDTLDNRLENLQLMSRSEHTSYHRCKRLAKS